MGNDRYKKLFKRSADVILIIRGDKFVDCNDATVRMLKYTSKTEVLNTHPSQLSPEYQPDGRLSYEKALPDSRSDTSHSTPAEKGIT